jgi:hypothetical protein
VRWCAVIVPCLFSGLNLLFVCDIGYCLLDITTKCCNNVAVRIRLDSSVSVALQLTALYTVLISYTCIIHNSIVVPSSVIDFSGQTPDF